VGKPFIITPQAQRDFDKTYWWYEEQYQGLGKEFALCVDAKIEEIQRFPEQFQRSAAKKRRAFGVLSCQPSRMFISSTKLSLHLICPMFFLAAVVPMLFSFFRYLKKSSILLFVFTGKSVS
jgi:hypothetical protein